jgi:hypothetical protein
LNIFCELIHITQICRSKISGQIEFSRPGVVVVQSDVMVEYELDNKHSLIIVRFRGCMDLKDINELMTDNRIAGSEDNYMNLLIDIRYANTDCVDELNENDDLENMINENAMYSNFLILGSIDQLFSELGLNLRKRFKSNLKAFTTFNEVMHWINNNEKVLNSE